MMLTRSHVPPHHSIWLVDLARYLPASARIEGFDIDQTQCPPREWLPSNVSVHYLNCLAPIPKHLLEQFDIVHIQLFHLAVHNNDPAPIIQNLVSLLSTCLLSPFCRPTSIITINLFVA